jgi:hypothetical protein
MIRLVLLSWTLVCQQPHYRESFGAKCITRRFFTRIHSIRALGNAGDPLYNTGSVCSFMLILVLEVIAFGCDVGDRLRK